MAHIHFVIICRECEAVIMECRCTGVYKPLYKEICEKCRNKLLGFEEQIAEEGYKGE